MTASIRSWLVMLLMLTALLVGACKKTVENQTAAWKSNVTKVEALQAQYPGMKPALQARLDEAKPLHEAASSLEGDAKIEKLSAANGALMKGFVRDLDGLDAKIKKLREARAEVTAKAGDASSRKGAEVAAKDAEKAIERAQAALKTGAKTPAAADAVLKKIASDLDTAQSAIDKVAGVDSKKKADAKADKDAKADAKAKADADAKAAVADWKCEYCGNMNAHDHKECGGCGAGRGGKKKKAADAKAKAK